MNEEFSKKLDDIHSLLILMKFRFEKINEKLDDIDSNVDNLTKKIDEDLIKECKKMGVHIDFIETVYDNVKHPLGYICTKVKYLTGNNETQYTLKDEPL